MNEADALEACDDFFSELANDEKFWDDSGDPLFTLAGAEVVDGDLELTFEAGPSVDADDPELIEMVRLAIRRLKRAYEDLSDYRITYRFDSDFG